MNRIINLPANTTKGHIFDTMTLPRARTPKRLEFFTHKHVEPDAYPLSDGTIKKNFGAVGISAQYDQNSTITTLDEVLGNSEFKCKACKWHGVPSFVECDICPKCGKRPPDWKQYRDNRCLLQLFIDEKQALAIFLRQLPVVPLKGRNEGPLPTSAAFFRFTTPGMAMAIKPKEKIKITLDWAVRPPAVSGDMLLRVGLIGMFYE